MRSNDIHLREALGRIEEIRDQMVRSSVFRGYRAVPVAATGLLAVAGAVAQPHLVGGPPVDPRAWLKLWIGIAVLGILATGTEIVLRYVRSGSPLSRSRTRLAAGQFAPCLLAGAALTFTLVRVAPDTLSLLPGLWSILFGLGIFASRPVLPRPFLLVAVLYLAAGLATLALARGPHALSPLAMGVPFGAGQLASALVLRLTLERRRGP